LDLVTAFTDRDWVSRNINRDKVSAEKVIDILLRKAGWRWYTPFKTTGALTLPIPLKDGSHGKWKFTLTLTKNAAGKRQLHIER
jgi:hypothetical protein